MLVKTVIILDTFQNTKHQDINNSNLSICFVHILNVVLLC